MLDGAGMVVVVAPNSLRLEHTRNTEAQSNNEKTNSKLLTSFTYRYYINLSFNQIILTILVEIREIYQNGKSIASVRIDELECNQRRINLLLTGVDCYRPWQ